MFFPEPVRVGVRQRCVSRSAVFLISFWQERNCTDDEGEPGLQPHLAAREEKKGGRSYTKALACQIIACCLGNSPNSPVVNVRGPPFWIVSHAQPFFLSQ